MILDCIFADMLITLQLFFFLTQEGLRKVNYIAFLFPLVRKYKHCKIPLFTEAMCH